MEFPHIKKIHVVDCFAAKDITIDTGSDEPNFKHIILTGKNGSGKTTILTAIANVLEKSKNKQGLDNQINNFKALIASNPGHVQVKGWEEDIQLLSRVKLYFTSTENRYFIENKDYFILSFFRAHRRVELQKVETVTKESQFLEQLNKNSNSENLVAKFKQYLVNKKVYQAFDYMDTKDVSENEKFFANFENILKDVLKDCSLKLEFHKEDFEFFLKLSDGRKITFNQLSEGYSAFLSIVMDLIIRTDLIRKLKNDYTYNPYGFVIIDEPETHFHLAMQYQILPFINQFFPNVQLIVATHSPAVISSLKNAIVYDLSSKEQVADWLLGSSFSELMIKHFGLENEFSPTADKILADIDSAYKQRNIEQLKDVLVTNEKYLTPSLRLEIESRIIELEAKDKKQ
jgi:predicted ATP-binding protein involved in virulence